MLCKSDKLATIKLSSLVAVKPYGADRSGTELE